MLEYETYPEKKWLERYGIREDSVYLRKENGRVKDEQGREYCSGESVMKKHLEDVGMNYTMHLRFAWILALKLFLLSLIALVHGMLPFIFTSTVSDGVNQLNHELDQRNHT
jgi:hypothetical protein